MAITPSEAAAELLQRRQARTQLKAWALQCGYVPAAHHMIVINALQKAVDRYRIEGRSTNLMILMPPGSAKSTYTSKLFPPWFLAQLPNLAILACSHSAELACDFGRAGRNLVESNANILGYTLCKDSRSADSWAISNGGYYRAAGCGAGISGRRADLGLIDDFVGTEEEAGSKTFNDKIWNWWLNDFVPRLKPNAIRVIIANHRNEDDLVGRLLVRESDKWEVIRLRLLIETDEQSTEDPMGRKVGEWLWPEYFTQELVTERMLNPKASGIEQQEPSPEKGDFFKAEWFDNNIYHSRDDFAGGHLYGASDHAVSESQSADNTVMGMGVYKNGILYIHPDITWGRLGPKETVEKWLGMLRLRNPLLWWAEKGHISKSLLPFLMERMKAEHVYANIIQVVPVKDKTTRAQSINGMMSMGCVKWPSVKLAPWITRARREMLMFPNGKHDDFVDFVAHLGRGIAQMSSARQVKKDPEYTEPRGFNITPRLMRCGDARRKRLTSIAFIDR